ncbi:hypothetical protein GIB67_014942 [Kingdonia uniflora]|uniref:Uncharacterized protein n=1 Tax=Kingdonia uniflora TaxID=39325 RepID=A0A7J7MTY1_9MAGN|nr:hypothetical protein GIB67_014942 [Kingdonia uniflora]
MEAWERRIEQKIAVLKEKFYGDHDLDWVMPNLVELESEDPICGMAYAHWWRCAIAGHHDISSSYGTEVEVTHGFDLTASGSVPEALIEVNQRPPMAVTNTVSWHSEEIRYIKNEVFLDGITQEVAITELIESS